MQIYQFLLKTDLVNLKSNVDKLDINKLKVLSSNLSKLKIERDKLDVNKLVPINVDLSKLSNFVRNNDVKKRCISC